MKNYYYNDTESSKFFIKNYKIKNHKIIVNTGDGKKYSIPYTRENEENILGKMKEQIICNYSFKKYIKENNSIINLLIDFSLIISLITFVFIPLSLPIVILINVIGLSYNLINSKKKNDLLKDFKKQEFFLKNEVKLNNIDENNPNSLLNVSEKTKEIISTVPNEKPKFTLNTIHKMKYQDLKEILENIEIIETLGYNTTNIENNNSDIKGWQKTNSK